MYYKSIGCIAMRMHEKKLVCQDADKLVFLTKEGKLLLFQIKYFVSLCLRNIDVRIITYYAIRQQDDLT